MSRLHLQSLTPTNPHWARVVGYGPFSLWVIHKEDLCPRSGDINRLMMMKIEDYVLGDGGLLLCAPKDVKRTLLNRSLIEISVYSRIFAHSHRLCARVAVIHDRQFRVQ
jgi:hypothetical protein